MIRRILTDKCDATKCTIGCCMDAYTCAKTQSDCSELQVGQACLDNDVCSSGCCVDRICRESGSCKVKELGMLAFFAVFILSSIIILIVGLYFHIRRKRARALNNQRRINAPRIRQIIAEGHVNEEDSKPPIVTVGIQESLGDLSDSKTDLTKPYLRKLDPVRTSLEGFDKVIWRSRANSRTTQPMLPKAQPNQQQDQPQELNNFDPYLETKSSPLRRPLDEAKEVPMEEITISHELANQILNEIDADNDYNEE